MSDKSELAALKKKVEALESALSGKEDKPKPKKEFVPQPYERYDPTAGMSMPRSALMAMAQDPSNQVMRGVIQDRHAPTSPSFAGTSGAVSGVHRDGPVNTSGWRDAAPIGPPPGVAQADRLMDAQDRRDKIELAQRLAAHEAAMRAAQKGKG